MTDGGKTARRRVRARISGRVQGVAFRAATQETARALGLSGWVRNLPDGDVEAVFEGDPQAVERMVDWCHRGPPLARVARVDASDEAPLDEGDPDFRVRF